MTPKHRQIRRNLFDAPQDAEVGSRDIAPDTEQITSPPAGNNVRKIQPPTKTALTASTPRRKIQLSRSHPFDFNHFSRILALLLSRGNAVKVPRKDIIEQTGLPDGQVASLLSIGVGMGLIQPIRQTLTATGSLIAQRDLFLEDVGTLQWCHFKGAGTWRNYFWFEAFNHVLVQEPAMPLDAWQAYFKARLQGQYTDKTISDHVAREIRFLVQLYREQNFNKLDLLHFTPDEKLYRRRHVALILPVFCAMLYDLGQTCDTHLLQVADVSQSPGSPAVVFGLDAAAFRHLVERLHDRGWLRYETTHNLDQIRLLPDLSALELLTAYYEQREPLRNPFNTQSQPVGNFQ